MSAANSGASKPLPAASTASFQDGNPDIDRNGPEAVGFPWKAYKLVV
ncbi:MAG TPA: hypothetical protein VGZ73_29065 [Bryobacteraceae bacterium]|nr:hypothetical protein [Bryobacteraceae bacterium]